jgi:hypothetical protein
MGALAPPTIWAGRLGGAGPSAPRRRPNRRAPYENGLPAGPLGWGELPIVSLSPHSSCARQALTAVMLLQPLGEATAWTTPTCRSSPPQHWARRAPRQLWRCVFIGGNAALPRFLPLDAVVIPIVLSNLSLLVLRLARSPPPLRGLLVAVEDRLLRERCLGRHKMRALQLRKQGASESAIIGGPREDQLQTKETKINEELVGGSGDLPISRSPR